MNKATIKLLYINEAGTSTVNSEDVEADGLINIEREAILAGNEVEFDVGITITPTNTVKGFCCTITKSKGETSDKTFTASLRTNAASSGSPTQTFTGITPVSGVGWSAAMLTACPLTANITKFFVKNDGTGKVDVAIRALIDTTPSEVG